MFNKNAEGRTPLHYAAMCQDANIIKMMIDAGADVDVLDENNCTPLHYASQRHDNAEAIILLMEADDYGLIDPRGTPPPVDSVQK